MPVPDQDARGDERARSSSTLLRRREGRRPGGGHRSCSSGGPTPPPSPAPGWVRVAPPAPRGGRPHPGGVCGDMPPPGLWVAVSGEARQPGGGGRPRSVPATLPPHAIGRCAVRRTTPVTALCSLCERPRDDGPAHARCACISDQLWDDARMLAALARVDICAVVVLLRTHPAAGHRSRRSLGRLMADSQATVSGWEAGTREPTTRVVLRALGGPGAPGTRCGDAGTLPLVPLPPTVLLSRSVS